MSENGGVKGPRTCCRHPRMHRTVSDSEEWSSPSSARPSLRNPALEEYTMDATFSSSLSNFNNYILIPWQSHLKTQAKYSFHEKHFLVLVHTSWIFLEKHFTTLKDTGIYLWYIYIYFKQHSRNNVKHTNDTSLCLSKHKWTWSHHLLQFMVYIRVSDWKDVVTSVWK